MELKDLLNIAKKELKDLSTLQNPDFRLEQVEYKKDKGIWDIIVSYLVENTNKRINPLIPAGSEFQFHRVYKRLKVNKDKELEGFYLYDNH